MRWAPWRRDHHHDEERARQALKDAHADAALLASREPHVRALINRADAVAARTRRNAALARGEIEDNHLSQVFRAALREGL